jgi:hypothetical protein
MTYHRQKPQKILRLENRPFDEIWKRYDGLEPCVVPELEVLYVPWGAVCPGIWSFLREVFPNCEVHVGPM